MGVKVDVTVREEGVKVDDEKGVFQKFVENFESPIMKMNIYR